MIWACVISYRARKDSRTSEGGSSFAVQHELGRLNLPWKAVGVPAPVDSAMWGVGVSALTMQNLLPPTKNFKGPRGLGLSSMVAVQRGTISQPISKVMVTLAAVSPRRDGLLVLPETDNGASKSESETSRISEELGPVKESGLSQENHVRIVCRTISSIRCDATCSKQWIARVLA